jgi:hypothetical protein
VSSRPRATNRSTPKSTVISTPLSDSTDYKPAPRKYSTAAPGLEALAAKYGITRMERPMDAKEVAIRLNVSVQEVYKIAPTIGGYFRLGRLVRFDRRKFEDWLKALTSTGKGTAK